MAAEDFDRSSLARYLHLSPAQVEKLVKRQEIPARRVGGQEVFSRAEVHHWMESRMGLLDDGELAAIEDRLQSKTTPAPVSVTGMLALESIDVLLPAKTRRSVYTKMAELAANTGMLWDAKKMADAVRTRDDMQSTAMDNGVALLHPRRPMSNILGESVLALGLSGQGIPFGSPVLTDVFWLICSIDDRSHLQTLARISRLIALDSFLPDLRACGDSEAVLDLVRDSEQQVADG